MHSGCPFLHERKDAVHSGCPFLQERKDVVLVMLNPRAEASEASFGVDVKFSKTKLLAGDKFKIAHDKKTGKVTVSMPATSYAIVKLQ